MRRVLEVILVVFLPVAAMAQATNTPTPNRAVKPVDAIRALYLAVNTTTATAVPTAYGTSGTIVNTKPLRSIDVTNDLDCLVYIALDGATADNYVVPSKSALTLDLQKLGLYHDKNISVRSAAVCASGSIYVTGSY